MKEFVEIKKTVLFLMVNVNVIQYNISHHWTYHVNMLVAKVEKKMNWFSTSISVCQHNSTFLLSPVEIKS